MRFVPYKGKWSSRELRADLLLLIIGAVGLAVSLKFALADLSPFAHANDNDPVALASMVQARGRVRVRAEGMLTWKTADAATTLRSGDSIFVGVDSTALLSLKGGSSMEVDENSLARVVHDPETASSHGSPLDSLFYVEIARGRAVLTAGAQGLNVRAGRGRSRIDAGSKLLVKLLRDFSGEWTAQRGVVIAGNESEETNTLAAGERTRIAPDGAMLAHDALGVVLDEPEAGQTVYLLEESQQTPFRWNSGGAVVGCGYELSRDPGFESLVVDVRSSEQRVSVAAVPDGIYFWRVVCEHLGLVTYSEERRVTFVHERPPVIYRPKENAVILAPLELDAWFAWNELAHVDHYVVELSSGDRLVLRSRVDRPHFNYRAPATDTSYCLRVRASDPQRQDSPWSAKRCFKVITKPVPRAPKLFKPQIEVIPESEEEGTGSPVAWLQYLFESVAHADVPKPQVYVLRWEQIPGIDQYVIEIAEDSGFGNLVLRRTLAQNYFRWAPNTYRPHYWRVRSIDHRGRAGPFSEARSVGAHIRKPRLGAPEDEASFPFAEKSRTIALSWEDSRYLASYRVEVSTDELFDEPLTTFFVENEHRVDFDIPGPGEYYWRVVGIDQYGDTTGPSKARRFRVTVDTPRLIGPRDEKQYWWTEGGPSVRLRWSECYSHSYELQVTRNPRFEGAQSSSLERETSTVLQAVDPGVYHWRVRCMAPVGQFSARRVIHVHPDPPVLEAPEKNTRIVAVGTAQTVLFSWSGGGDISGFEVEIASVGDQADVEAMHFSGEGQELQVDELPLGQYRWRVMAIHDSGLSSPWSAERTFEIAQTARHGSARDTTVAAEAYYRRKQLHAGPRIGLFYNLDDVVSPSFGLELFWRPKSLAGLFAVGMAADYLTDRGLKLTDDNFEDPDGRLQAVPIYIAATYSFPMAWVVPYAGGGFTLIVQGAEATANSGEKVTETIVDFGGMVIVGVERHLGPGHLFFEFALALATERAQTFDLDGGGMLGTVGYRLGFF